MRGRLIVAFVLVMAAVLVAWRHRKQDAARAKTAVVAPVDTSHGLDPAAFRDYLARRRAAARAMEERRARAAAHAGVADAGVPPTTHGLMASMVEPRCILGPADLCATITPSVNACDGGDGQACLAVAQFLEDEPPRPLILLTFYMRGCKGGEQAACKRQEQLGKEAAAVACKDDLMACAWQGYRAKDATILDEACRLGVADACAFFLGDEGLDVARQRTYLERACQLGNPMACEELANRLSPTCAKDCYEPDRDAAKAAATIACDVGFDVACARLRT